MKLGFWSMNTLASPAPETLGPALVDRGFESLWVGEHTHIPVESVGEYRGGGEMPREYAQMLDPFLTLLAAAIAAPELVIGTAVSLPLQRDLLAMAKQVATLDRMVSGRFRFGVGVGWNRRELANHRSIPWASRYRALEERVAALRKAWSEDVAAFDGRFERFTKSWVEPKPVDPRGPEVLLGVGGPVGIAHAARWADGWMPMELGRGDPRARVRRFRQQVEDGGRDPAEVSISVLFMVDPTEELIDAYREAGVQRVVLGGGRRVDGSPLGVLDAWSAFVE